MSPPVVKEKLSNGLQIYLKEIHTAPIISHWVWYRVGSRNEVPGKTGISHWVEHMQFKGTPQFPSGELDKVISREGGVWNAFTHLDWTTYFETLPADKIDIALRLEADRMQNSVFDPEEVESERTVVISERQGNENEPLFRLGEAIQKKAFDSHPYGHEVIGDLDDLYAIQRDDLANHYLSNYAPGNAILCMAGDFDSESMLEEIRKHYGPIPKRAGNHSEVKPEKRQPGERRLSISGPGETAYLQIAYRSPKGSSRDFFVLNLLDSLLTGPSGLSMFGGGISNKTSRLYRKLVEGELTVNIAGSLQATIDPFMYEIMVTMRPDSNQEKVLEVIDDEIRRLQNEKINPDEIRRAVKQARALFAYGSESISNQAFWLGFSEMFSSYEWFTGYVEQLESITDDDLMDAARTILAPENRVVGFYSPEGRTDMDGFQ